MDDADPGLNASTVLERRVALVGTVLFGLLVAGVLIGNPLLGFVGIGGIVLLPYSATVGARALAEAARLPIRIGFLHVVAAVGVPLGAIGLLLGSPLAVIGVMPLVLIPYLGDVVTAVAYRAGSTTARDWSELRGRGGRAHQRDVTAGRPEFVARVVVGAHMDLLRRTERREYRGLAAVARLLLVAALPFGLLAAAGGYLQISGYDGVPLIVIGLTEVLAAVVAGALAFRRSAPSR
jgi:hypothetical protein